MTSRAGSGIIDTPSSHSVEETVRRLEEALRAKAGTPVMLAAPSVGANRPSRMLGSWAHTSFANTHFRQKGRT